MLANPDVQDGHGQPHGRHGHGHAPLVQASMTMYPTDEDGNEDADANNGHGQRAKSCGPADDGHGYVPLI